MICNEGYYVYAPNEKKAINRFTVGCLEYRTTNNKEFQKYWDCLLEAANNGEFTIMKNEDFLGVRKII